MSFVTLPTYELTLPSNGKNVKYRPYTVREEKVLAMAQESRSDRQIKQAMGDIVSACTFGAVDIEKNPMFDIQYAFLQMRIKSVGEISEVVLSCGQCEKENNHLINLESIAVQHLQPEQRYLDVAGVKVEMRYPTADTLIQIKEAVDIDEIFEAIVSCIVSIVTDDSVTVNTPDTEEQFFDFVSGLRSKDYAVLQQFFTLMPALSHTIIFDCEHCQTPNRIVVDGLFNFFL